MSWKTQIRLVSRVFALTVFALVIASAILDRLLHHSRVINIKGHSYRLKDHGFNKSYPKEGGEIVSTLPA